MTKFGSGGCFPLNQLYSEREVKVCTVSYISKFYLPVNLCTKFNRYEKYSPRMGKLRPSYFTRVGTLIVATIYLQLIQNRYMFRGFTFLQCSHQHCVQTVASDVEDVGYI